MKVKKAPSEWRGSLCHTLLSPVDDIPRASRVVFKVITRHFTRQVLCDHGMQSRNIHKEVLRGLGLRTKTGAQITSAISAKTYMVEFFVVV